MAITETTELTDKLILEISEINPNITPTEKIHSKANKNIIRGILGTDEIILKYPSSRLERMLFKNNALSISPKYHQTEYQDNMIADIMEYIPGATVLEIMWNAFGWEYTKQDDAIRFYENKITTGNDIKEQLKEIKKWHDKDLCGFDLKQSNIKITPEGKPYVIDGDIYYHPDYEIIKVNTNHLKQLDFSDLNNLFDSKLENQSKSAEYLEAMARYQLKEMQ